MDTKEHKNIDRKALYKNPNYQQEYQKKYRIEHYDKLLERVKERRKQKAKCECGIEILKDNLPKHLLTKRHATRMKSLE